MNIDELQQLIAAWVDGRISEADSLRLQDALLHSSDARLEFRRWTELDAALREQAGRMSDSRPSFHSNGNRSSGLRLRFERLGLIAAAACGLLALAVWSRGWFSPAKVEATAGGCAMLSQVFDSEFENIELRSGATLKPGLVKLKKGLAQIEFFSGATALLEGEGELEILSATEARCVRGRVRVHVPPAAKGFLMHAPGFKFEDLGTEFGLNVNGDDSAVHVFDGEIVAHADGKAPAGLKEGMSLSSDATEVDADKFLAIHELRELILQRQEKRFAEWRLWSKQVRVDPRLIAYYTFKHWADDDWDRVVQNFAVPPNKSRVGGAVGAQWVEGRWPGKEALEFKRPGDRVRMILDGSYSAISLVCWVKVDSLDKKYNSLLLPDGFGQGEPHWQIDADGRLMFARMDRLDEPASADPTQTCLSRTLFTPDSLGRWHHLAVTFDTTNGEVVQYFDGDEVGRDVLTSVDDDPKVVFGPCEIGNWGLPRGDEDFPIRNLNGAIDEFVVYGAALSPMEIRQHFEAGKPE